MAGDVAVGGKQWQLAMTNGGGRAGDGKRWWLVMADGVGGGSRRDR